MPNTSHFISKILTLTNEYRNIIDHEFLPLNGTKTINNQYKCVCGGALTKFEIFIIEQNERIFFCCG